MLKEFKRIRPIEIAEMLEAKPKSVRDELRRLSEQCILKEFITKEKTGVATYYIMNEQAKQAPVPFLKDLAKKTWKFNRKYTPETRT
jgi:hypothetical protein